MNRHEARRRAQEHAQFKAFISLADDSAADTSGEVNLVAVKDNIDVRGMVTTAGGKHLSPNPVETDAPIIAAIRSAGCQIIGKANMHEYAFGVTNHNVHYGIARNPRDESRIPGGSSGGSAVAVGLGLCDWAIGTDTGGSIRIPAGLCGIVGMKPTTGSLSIEGIFPLAESLDVPGPMAADVAGTARAWSRLTGVPDALAASAIGSQPNVAVPTGWEDELDSPSAIAWANVTAGLPRIDFPARKMLEDVFQPILFAEATSNHLEWLRDLADEYSEDVRNTLELGRKVTGAGYLWSLRQRERMRDEVERAIGTHDAVLVPNTTIVAPLIGEPHVREKLLHYTRPFSLTGHPVITIPAPTSGLPVGIQVVGHYGQDAELLAVAAALEADWGRRGPASR
jgi:aspartyl-tRNA(Asn)/glutamyl-tRNA(Gln) amidotransferase subunit A